MPIAQEFRLLIQKAAARRLLFLPHAIRQMSRSDRIITPPEVHSVIENGEIIEDYPDDPRGHSALLLGQGIDGRIVHVVCAPKEDYLAVITAYIPATREWSEDFRTRITL
jgi:hypothetical protein